MSSAFRISARTTFECLPDVIHWGHVGTLEHYAELLKRITDAASRKANTPRSTA